MVDKADTKPSQVVLVSCAFSCLGLVEHMSANYRRVWLRDSCSRALHNIDIFRASLNWSSTPRSDPPVAGCPRAVQLQWDSSH